MGVVFKGPCSDPFLILRANIRGEELKLDHRALWRPGYHAALVLWIMWTVVRYWIYGLCNNTTSDQGFMNVLIIGCTLTREEDRARTSHLVTRWVLTRVPVSPSQTWTFPAESPLMIVWSDRKAMLQTTTSLLFDAPTPLSTSSLCVARPDVAVENKNS